MGLGIAAVVVLWLVFSVLKKAIGLLVLAAVAFAGFFLWQNPNVVRALTAWLQSAAG